MVTRFLTANQDFARSDFSDPELEILPALNAYISRTSSERSAVQNLADNLKSAWQEMIDDFNAEMTTLIGDKWAPTGRARDTYTQEMNQLAEGKAVGHPFAAYC